MHNRVESIERAAKQDRASSCPRPGSRIAHGQMNEHALEQVIVDFWEKRVRRPGLHHDRRERPRHLQRQHADRRPRRPARPVAAAPAPRPRRAWPRARLRLLPLPAREAAHRDRARPARDHRRSNTDLGSGMAVAMKDLEIRGAGNLLGGEQSGHIADVGFDLYVRLVGEAVAEYRQGRTARPRSVLDVKVETAGRRARAARLRARGAAAARGVPRLAAATDRGRRRRGRRGAHRPLRRAPGAGRQPARRGAVPDPRPRGRRRRGRGAGELPAARPPSNCRSRARCACRGSTREAW